MKKILIVIAVFTSISGFSQYFEGKLDMKVDVKGVIDESELKMLSMMIGTECEEYLKEGNEMVFTNGTLFDLILLKQKDNKAYYVNTNAKIAYWEDIREVSDTIIDYIINKAVIQVLGYTCDELIVSTASSIDTIYFTTNLVTNIDWYKNNNSDNCYEKTKLTNGGLPLKIIQKHKDGFILTTEVTKITPQKLELSFFKLPKKMKIKKMEGNF